MSSFTRLVPWIITVCGITLIHHEDVNPIPEDYVFLLVPLMTGCVPFPAVDSQGRIGRGLKVTGENDGKCSLSIGQVYGRTGTYGGNFAAVWTWYFPKEQFNSYGYTRGHRHGFQTVVFWYASEEVTLPYIMRYTSFGKFKSDSRWAVQNGHPVLLKKYGQLWSDVETTGGYQTLIAWDLMPLEARKALNEYDFGPHPDQLCLFNDINFENTLAKSWIPPQ